MDHERDRDGFRVEFEAELNYSQSTTDGPSRTMSAKEPGVLEADGAGVRQHFETPSKLLWGKPRFDKRALFSVALSDVSSLRWNEATGDVQLITRRQQGRRAHRPMFFSERDVAVETAERLASLWFPSAVRERSAMTDREQRLSGLSARVFGAVFLLIPVVGLIALIVTGVPVVIALIFGAVLLLFAMLGRSLVKHSKAERDDVAELVAAGKGWVEVVNRDFQIS